VVVVVDLIGLDFEEMFVFYFQERNPCSLYLQPCQRLPAYLRAASMDPIEMYIVGGREP
jgi:hypothetical protein